MTRPFSGACELEGLIGTPASTFYFGSMASISSVCVKVLGALDHAHSRRIVHLDVSSCNIIVRQDLDGSVQAQLVDWGCALAIGESITKFRGKSHFAHDDLHGLKGGIVMSLTLVAEYDLAALVYSMAEIVFKSQSSHAPVFSMPNMISTVLAKQCPWRPLFSSHPS